MDSEGDEAVYASVLARVERPKLAETLRQVVDDEWTTVKRRLRRATASVTALRQLQAAAQHLRPSGDCFQGLGAEVAQLQQLQKRLASAVDGLEVDRGQQKKQRRRTQGEEDTRRTEDKAEKRPLETKEDESDVEIVQVVRPRQEDTLEDKERKEKDQERRSEDILEDKRTVDIVTVDDLPCGLVRRTRDAFLDVKEETFSDEQMGEELVEEEAVGEVESPVELEVLESSDESAVELSDGEEVAVELQVFDSESDEDFSPWVEMATKLEKAKVDTQVAQFPGAVAQLTSYLVDKKHLAVDELDGYLFAHKRISDEELEEIGRAITSLVAVGMKLPLRPTIKLALHDLHLIVDQLEVTLGELPVLLRPFKEKLSRYVLVQIAESNNIGAGGASRW